MIGPAPQKLVRHLPERIIKLRASASLIVTGEPPMPDVANEAHNTRRAGTQPGPDVLADGLLSAKCLLRHHFVDDDDRLVLHAVLTVEEAALAQAWPKLSKARGKFFFLLDETGKKH